MKKGRQTYLILHDIRSAQNVGALFRTADAAGITKIFLTGYTPTPVDRFERPKSDIAKAALGAEKTVPWESAKLAPLLRALKKDDVQIVAIEQDKRAVDYKKARIARAPAFIVGNEVTGLPRSVIASADLVAEIPMYGSKESLNVSVAAGIALFRMLGL